MNDHNVVPTKSSHIHQLLTVLDLTRTLLEKARSSEWDEMTVMGKQRDLLVKTAFQQPTPHAEAEQVAKLIKQILELDKDIISLCSKEREALSKNIQSYKQGRAAVRSYENQY